MAKKSINFNTISQHELEKIPGIGKIKAELIIERRNVRDFKDISDLVEVEGITRTFLSRLNNKYNFIFDGKQTVQKLNTLKRPLKQELLGTSIDQCEEDEELYAPEKKPKSHFLNSKSLLGCSQPSTLNLETVLSSRKIPSCDSPGKAVRSRLHSETAKPPDGLTDWLDKFSTWSRDERLIALNDLIGLCDMSIVRHMMAKIEPHFQRDFISLLPKELALYVLSFLEPKDLSNAARTCRYWRILGDDNLLWKEKCHDYEMFCPLSELLEKTNIGKRTTKGELPYKQLFVYCHKLEKNWRTNSLRPITFLKGHDDHVVTCLQFDGVRIVSASDDNTLKVWSAETGKLIRTLVGHTGGVWSSQLSGNIVVSGSTDRTLRVWNADSGECIHVLQGHTSTVRCLSMYGNDVVSGSRDGTLRVWDVVEGVCQHVLIGHAAAVRCVQYNGKYVVSGAYDYLVKVWDVETEICLHTLTGHSNRVYSLQFDGKYIVSGSLDTSIRVWDAMTGQVLHTLLGHQSLTSGMVLKNNYLVSGNADSTVKIWDIVSGKCLHTLSGPNKHQSAVTSLQFNSKFVVTSSDDGSVKLWDIKTGEFLRNLVELDSGGSGGVVWRVKCNEKKLVCAVGSRNGTEETKLLVLDFDVYN